MRKMRSIGRYRIDLLPSDFHISRLRVSEFSTAYKYVEFHEVSRKIKIKRFSISIVNFKRCTTRFIENLTLVTDQRNTSEGHRKVYFDKEHNKFR